MSEIPARQPALFVGHGSPMNAVSDNDYTRALSRLGGRLKPEAVLCVSAHWLTGRTMVTGMARPRTIHDFGGFPEALYRVRYPAPGSPELAARVRALLGADVVGIDAEEWGLDHGAWSVLRHLFPKADVPVVQLGIDSGASARRHFELGEKLRPLREKGVLILGSGNVVHNLRRVSFDADAAPADWAVEFEAWVKARLEARDYPPLLGDLSAAPSGRVSVPTREHYDPLLYVLGASDEKDSLRFVYEGVQNASISMLSAGFGLD
jgi:4,5-DOPA dioxygenase extradiol